MGKQRRQRSWIRLLVTSVIAGAGLAVLRSLTRPGAPAEVPRAPRTGASNESVAAPAVSTPAVALTKAPEVSEPVAPPPDAPLAALQPEFEPVLDPTTVGGGSPQLAFVAEPTTPMYVPTTDTQSRWDPPTSPEWLPGFGPTGQHAVVDPWSSTVANPVVTAGGRPPLEQSSPEAGVGARFREWRRETPRKQMVYTILGVVCLLAAIVTTVLVLAL